MNSSERKDGEVLGAARPAPEKMKHISTKEKETHSDNETATEAS